MAASARDNPIGRRALAAGALALALLAAGCGGEEGDGGSAPAQGSALPRGAEHVELDPARFTTEIDNPLWPMSPGTRWVYRETEPGGSEQRIVVAVTNRTKRIANGIEARVVRDVVSEDGVPVEVTDDWFAQDAEGNVWYLGERTTDYERGKPVSHAGSFEAGIDGAEAGIAMPAEPEVGMDYRQEYYAGEAEDRARVLSTSEQVETPAGHFEEALLTKDLDPLEPRVLEYKLYAGGVGPVLAVHVSGGAGREELVRFEPGG